MVMSFGYAVITNVVARARRIKQRCKNVTSSKNRSGKDAVPEAPQSLTQTCMYAKASTPRGDRFTRSSSSEDDTVYSPTSSNSMSSTASPRPLNLRLQGWMYWARYDPVPGQQPALNDDGEPQSPKTQQTVIKVFAVLRNEFLLLYRDSHKSMRRNTGPLIQIAVERSGRSMDGAFHVFDPNGEEMELHLYDRNDKEIVRRWETALEQAVERTQSYLASLEVKVEHLPRNSMYRGTLHDFRSQRPSFRQSTHETIKSLTSTRSFRASIALGSRLRASIHRSSSVPSTHP